MLNPNFVTQKVEETPTYGKYIVDALPMSFGHSIGHAIRRTLLSSLEGAAITHVKFDEVDHMFATVKGVKESALEIILNLKQLRFKTSGEGPFQIKLTGKGMGKLYGKDVKSNIEVVNKDKYITEITAEKGRVNLEAIVEIGTGYSPIEEREKKETGYIPVDAFFSPVKKVNFKVEEARIGRKSNLDKLVLEIWTDGSMKPHEALRKSALLLSEYFAHVLSGKDTPTPKVEISEAESAQNVIDKKLYEIIIDELNLPSRVINALLRENIETVADLVKVGRDKLKVMKGVGKKSIELIEEELKKMGIQLN